MLLKADKGLIRDGLFGFNGALVALALVAFTSADFRTGAVPSPAMTVYIVFAAAMTTHRVLVDRGAARPAQGGGADVALRTDRLAVPVRRAEIR